jgi:hypothetical protein
MQIHLIVELHGGLYEGVPYASTDERAAREEFTRARLECVRKHLGAQDVESAWPGLHRALAGNGDVPEEELAAAYSAYLQHTDREEFYLDAVEVDVPYAPPITEERIAFPFDPYTVEVLLEVARRTLDDGNLFEWVANSMGFLEEHELETLREIRERLEAWVEAGRKTTRETLSGEQIARLARQAVDRMGDVFYDADQYPDETAVCPECGGDVRVKSRSCPYCQAAFDEPLSRNLQIYQDAAACVERAIEEALAGAGLASDTISILAGACRTALEDCEAALSGEWDYVSNPDGFEATAGILREALARAEV